MTLHDIVTLIRDLGFPVVVALYLLFRLDKRLLELTKAVNRMALANRDHYQKEERQWHGNGQT